MKEPQTKYDTFEHDQVQYIKASQTPTDEEAQTHIIDGLCSSRSQRASSFWDDHRHRQNRPSFLRRRA
jgi:hypothetical protein